MLPDRVSIPGPLNYESGALPIALHGPASETDDRFYLSHSGSWCPSIVDHCCVYSQATRKIHVRFLSIVYWLG